MQSTLSPAHIAVKKSKGIRIDWSDGQSSDYELQHLRDNCPCADCTGAHGTPPKKKESPFQMYTEALKIDSVETVGNYAIKIRWNDGHHHGIYTWNHLRAIAREPNTEV